MSMVIALRQDSKLLKKSLWFSLADYLNGRNGTKKLEGRQAHFVGVSECRDGNFSLCGSTSAGKVFRVQVHVCGIINLLFNRRRSLRARHFSRTSCPATRRANKIFCCFLADWMTTAIDSEQESLCLLEPPVVRVQHQLDNLWYPQMSKLGPPRLSGKYPQAGDMCRDHRIRPSALNLSSTFQLRA